ncbi:MAG: DegV family protein [Clostridia bacterium]|nr:DegV family protein [Clostridia bacterium]
MAYQIWTDTSANLPGPLCKELGIGVLPFHFIHNGGPEECCLDTDAFSYEEYYEDLKNGGVATTSMINSEAYREIFEREAAAGNDVLYIGMSSGISGAYGASAIAAREAGERYPDHRFEVFDTRGASLGEGLLVLAAQKLRKAGADLQKVLRELDRLRTHMMQIFTVDDLMYLKRGGRISRMKAAIASVLNIKPILRGDEEGRIVVTNKTVGRKASIRTLADDLIENIDEKDACGIGIAQAGCSADAQSLVARIRAKFPSLPILTVPYEPVTGSHVGPGALALFYISRTARTV